MIKDYILMRLVGIVIALSEEGASWHRFNLSPSAIYIKVDNF
jgi:hypothetical protein